MTTCIKMGKIVSHKITVSKGLIQGWFIAPEPLKNHLNEGNHWENVKIRIYWLHMGGSSYCINFTDDQIILTKGDMDINYMLRKLTEEYMKWNLKINASTI